MGVFPVGDNEGNSDVDPNMDRRGKRCRTNTVEDRELIRMQDSAGRLSKSIYLQRFSSLDAMLSQNLKSPQKFYGQGSGHLHLAFLGVSSQECQD